MKRMNFPGRKNKRREEGEARNARWQSMSLAAKLTRLSLADGESVKQRAKLSLSEVAHHGKA